MEQRFTRTQPLDEMREWESELQREKDQVWDIILSEDSTPADKEATKERVNNKD